jgi:membrane-bound metal-dependent hydrolase YbcI (DUF457 family)
VGSEIPDFDALFELGGPVFGFVHHRGITHSLLGGAGLALLGAALLWSVWRAHPYWRVTWLVYLGVLLHIGMDYLTSYGTQIFLPFSTGHYTADALFIVDFTYSALMIAGLLLVRMVRRQRQERYGRASLVWVGLGGIAWRAAPAVAERPLTLLALQSAGLHVMAFALVVGLMARVCRHWKEHRAVVLGQIGVGAVLGYVALCVVNHAVAQHQMARTLGSQMAHVQRLAALPLPGSGPLQWRAIAVTDTTYLVSRVTIFPGTVTAPQSIAKGPGADNSVIQAASRYSLVRVFWNFARFPVIDYYVQDTETIVRYTDLRFSGDGRNRSWFDLIIHFDPAGQVQVIEFLNRLFHPTHPEF